MVATGMCPHDEGYNGPGRRLEGGQVQGPGASEGTGQGLRKAILINEHFVVYGAPAIAVPVFLPVEVQVSVRRGSGLRVLVHPATGEVTWHTEDTDRFEAIRRVMKAMDSAQAPAFVLPWHEPCARPWTVLARTRRSTGLPMRERRSLLRILLESTTPLQPTESLSGSSGEGRRHGNGFASASLYGSLSGTPRSLPGPATRLRGLHGSERLAPAFSRT